MKPLVRLPIGLIILIVKVAFLITNINASDRGENRYRNCTTVILKDENYCKSETFWKSAAIGKCDIAQKSSIVPQWIKACPLNMYREVILHCCSLKKSSSKKSESELLQNQILNLDQENEDDINLFYIRRNDNILKEYLENHVFTSNMSHEKANYNKAKKALSETYSLRHAALEKELKEAELHISTEEWINHPELSQNAEDSLHSEFRQKFVTLDNDKDIDNQNVEHVYRDLIFKQIERRNKAAISMWEEVLKTKEPNMTQLMQTAQRLLHAIQRNRHAALMYYKQIIAASNRSEGDRWLEECRKSLSDLELLLLDNLLNLKKFPQLSEIITTKLEKYRQEKYGRLDEAIRTFLVMPVLPRPSPNTVSMHEQSLHNADMVIEKYRHRSSKSSKVPQTIGHPRVKVFQQPEVIKVDQVKTLSTIQNVERAPTEEEQQQKRVDKTVRPEATTDQRSNTLGDTSTKAPREERKLRMQMLFTKHFGELPSVPKSQLPVIPQLESPGKRAHVTTVNSYSPAAVIVTYVSMGILLPVVLFVTGRWCVRRLRRYRERASYTLTTVEVDEQLNRWPNGPEVATVKPAACRQNRLSRWQTSGYVNPAYRHKETYFPYSQPTVS